MLGSGRKLEASKNCLGRDSRREMPGSYSLVRMGALNETVWGQAPLAWDLGVLESCLLGIGFGGCRNIPSHPVQGESLKKRAVLEIVP